MRMTALPLALPVRGLAGGGVAGLAVTTRGGGGGIVGGREALDNAIAGQHTTVDREVATHHEGAHGRVLLGQEVRLVRQVCLVFASVDEDQTRVPFTIPAALVRGIHPTSASAETLKVLHVEPPRVVGHGQWLACHGGRHFCLRGIVAQWIEEVVGKVCCGANRGRSPPRSVRGCCREDRSRKTKRSSDEARMRAKRLSVLSRSRAGVAVILGLELEGGEEGQKGIAVSE
jgi:hypothetical protein